MSFPTDETQDPRERELADGHSVMAKEALRTLTARTLEIAQESGLENVPDEVRESLAAKEQFEYPVWIALGGAIVITLDAYFTDLPYTFHGVSGGLALGGGITWGTAWFNYPIDRIIGWDARFWASFATGVTAINYWGMSGEVIGSMIAGGLNVGVGGAGGQGTFRLR
ncbi:hypothetical protein [Streptomyces sp. NBC_00696]|uniref:hypothetical protein n=1 Tax=Streptomyces sp. NBC_00696 TaxID=2903672 RepID=UPI002E342BCB|nr:hypothetical protein [Streptomyces sp. NBC_00696]